MAGSSVLEYYEHLKSLGFFVCLFTDKGLTSLSIETVKSISLQDTEHYFNIYATRNVD